MIGRPEPNEAAPHFHHYINLVPGDDPLTVIESQLAGTASLLAGISEEASLHRYQPDKWSIRQLLNHVTDNERAFAFRTLWFARGFTVPLPGYDQNIAAACAGADGIPWSEHLREFEDVRGATISLFRNMPPEGWTRSGVASGNPVTVRAMAYIIPGHLTHHIDILRERYL